ncbi:MAG: hypothetical protein RIT02_2217 [Planctomycetota bacterium]
MGVGDGAITGSHSRDCVVGVLLNSIWLQKRGIRFRQNTKNRLVIASGSEFGVVFGVDD